MVSDSQQDGRVIALGDVHGCDVALELMLDRLALSRSDTLVCLGDVVDRGPNTKRCIEMLLDLRDACDFVFLLGNHEEMMLRAVVGAALGFWLSVGGAETLESYGRGNGGRNGGRLEDVPDEHLELFNSAESFYETDSEVFVHASVEVERPMSDQDVYILRWEPVTGLEEPHYSGKRVVCGHTAQRTGLPRVWDGWVCIDTCAYGGLYLTALDVTNDVVYQTSQAGECLDPRPLADFAGR